MMRQQTWKPITAGVLSIIAGAFGVAFGLMILLLGGIASGILSATGVPSIIALIPFPLAGGIAVPLLVLGTVSIVGGIYAVQRRFWSVALAGAICALFPPQFTLLGVLAIVLVVLGKDEFD
jgi:hypothetical protein